MAKLPRKQQKIFAENAGVNGTAQFGTPQNILSGQQPAYTQDIEQIQNDNYSTGWSSAVPSNYNPFREDFNSVNKVTTQQLAYLFQEGIPEWEINTTYYKGSTTKVNVSAGFRIYSSLSDNNKGNAPTTSTSQWKLVFDTEWVLVRNGIDQTITGGKTFAYPVTVSSAITTSFVAMNNTMDSTVVPAANQYCGYDIRDKNGVRLTWFGVMFDTNGNMDVQIQKVSAKIKDIKGITPSNSVAGVQIVTAAWVRGYAANNGLSNLSSAGKNNLLITNVPNYSAAVVQTPGTSYKATANGIVYVIYATESAGVPSFKINGREMYGKGQPQYSDTFIQVPYPVKVNDTYQSYAFVSDIVFYPFTTI